jgi:septal ring factor EnvC (AmiA/AmiB activator)
MTRKEGTVKVNPRQCGNDVISESGTRGKPTRALRWAAAIRLLAACILLGGAASAHSQTSDNQHNIEEAQAKQKLDEVRAEIRAITEAQKQVAVQKSDTTTALRAQELKISASAKEVRGLDQKLEGQQARLVQLVKQRDALESTLKTQREALAALLRSAYALGRNEELRLLLAQDEVGSIGRLVAYYHYFERARVAEIEHLLKDLEALAQVQAAIEEETARIAESRAARVTDADRLEAERAERRQVLATLEATLHDQQSRLAALGKDEKGLLQLLEKLRDVFADIPKQIAGAEPFAQLRGRLLIPLHGSLQAGSAGDEKDSHGILIVAAEGGEVHAVSHGRVVFADWLRGYGLLLIVDHGDGYLSLYGCNESLLKDVGDWVDANEVIATSGASGGRKTAGLYFELRHDGKPLDARAWLKSSRPR